jgi:hypothetical protein
MGAAHQGALRGHVELRFGDEFAGRGIAAHVARIVECGGEVKARSGKAGRRRVVGFCLDVTEGSRGSRAKGRATRGVFYGAAEAVP